MKSICFFFILFIISCSTAVKKECISVDISKHGLLEKWRADSTGCLGDRLQIIKDGQVDLNEWIGFGVECLENTLGNPDPIYSIRDQTYTDYVYFVTCKYSPPFLDQDSIINSEATLLVMHLDMSHQVYRYSVVTP